MTLVQDTALIIVITTYTAVRDILRNEAVVFSSYMQVLAVAIGAAIVIAFVVWRLLP